MVGDKKKGMARGLSSILGDDISVSNETSIIEVKIEDIEANPWQPRDNFDQEKLEELSASIKSVGIIQPLTLRKIENGKYQIIAGERRFRASKMAELETVPAYIREANDDIMLKLALIENIQRSDLDPIEEALSYQRLINECQLTQENMAESVGKSRSAVTNSLRLLKLPAEIQAGLRQKLISTGHARAIAGIDDEATQVMLYQQTIEYGYSVRRIEELVREYNEKNDDNNENKKNNNNNNKKKSLDSEYKALKMQLSNFFDSDVKFSRNDNGSGKITIPFTSDDDLERIMAILDKAK